MSDGTVLCSELAPVASILYYLEPLLSDSVAKAVEKVRFRPSLGLIHFTPKSDG